MDKLKIDDFEIYKSFKKTNLGVFSAVCRIIDQCIDNFKSTDSLNEKSVIVVYWNNDGNWIQVMDNSNGLLCFDIPKIWQSYKNNYNIGFIASCFKLGDIVTIESKDTNEGYKTSVKLNEPNEYAPIEYFKSSEMMRTFSSGFRVTIDNVGFKLSINDAHTLYQYIAFAFEKIIKKNNISIIVAYVDNKQTYDVSKKEYKKVEAINQIKKITISNDSDMKLIVDNESIFVDNKKLSFTTNIYKNSENKEIFGIAFSCNDRYYTPINNLIIPPWFNINYQNIFVDIQVKDNYMDLYRTSVVFDEITMNQIIDSIKEKLIPFKSVNNSNHTEPKSTATKKFLESNDNLNETKRFLTKIFKETGKISNFDDFEIIKDKLRFTYTSDDGKKITMNLIKSKQKDIKNEWLQLIPINEERLEQIYEYDLKLNLNHPYFVDLVDKPEFIHKWEHFVICYAIAECIARLDGSPVTQIKYEINKLLREHNDK